jgi:PAS domain S-box-containing protein
LVEGSLQGVIIVRHFKPLFLNSAYAAMFGYTPRELLALDSSMVLFTPHECQRLRGYHEARLRGEPAPTHYEFQGVKRDGTPIWLETRVQVIDWNGIHATQASVVDITARKSAEVNLQTRLRQQAAVADLG